MVEEEQASAVRREDRVRHVAEPTGNSAGPAAGYVHHVDAGVAGLRVDAQEGDAPTVGREGRLQIDGASSEPPLPSAVRRPRDPQRRPPASPAGRADEHQAPPVGRPSRSGLREVVLREPSELRSVSPQHVDIRLLVGARSESKTPAVGRPRRARRRDHLQRQAPCSASARGDREELGVELRRRSPDEHDVARRIRFGSLPESARSVRGWRRHRRPWSGAPIRPARGLAATGRGRCAASHGGSRRSPGRCRRSRAGRPIGLATAAEEQGPECPPGDDRYAPRRSHLGASLTRRGMARSGNRQPVAASRNTAEGSNRGAPRACCGVDESFAPSSADGRGVDALDRQERPPQVSQERETPAVAGLLQRALCRTRTGDPFLTMEVLYQLS